MTTSPPLPTPDDFYTFINECDHIWPLGWPAQLDLPPVAEASTNDTLARTIVGRWLAAQEHYRPAEHCLQRSKFYRSLKDEESRAFARTRFAIDAGCGIGEYVLHDKVPAPAGTPSPFTSQVSTNDRRRAKELAGELARLMDKGVDLASEHRTRALYWALRDIEKELKDQLDDAVPVTSPQRRDATFKERALVYVLARRFFRSFLEALPSAIQHIVEIISPEKLDDKTVRNICHDLQERRDRAPGTWFLKPQSVGKPKSGS